MTNKVQILLHEIERLSHDVYMNLERNVEAIYCHIGASEAEYAFYNITSTYSKVYWFDPINHASLMKYLKMNLEYNYECYFICVMDNYASLFFVDKAGLIRYKYVFYRGEAIHHFVSVFHSSLKPCNCVSL